MGAILRVDELCGDPGWHGRDYRHWRRRLLRSPLDFRGLR